MLDHVTLRTHDLEGTRTLTRNDAVACGRSDEVDLELRRQNARASWHQAKCGVSRCAVSNGADCTGVNEAVLLRDGGPRNNGDLNSPWNDPCDRSTQRGHKALLGEAGSDPGLKARIAGFRCAHLLLFALLSPCASGLPRRMAIHQMTQSEVQFRPHASLPRLEPPAAHCSFCAVRRAHGLICHAAGAIR